MSRGLLALNAKQTPQDNALLLQAYLHNKPGWVSSTFLHFNKKCVQPFANPGMSRNKTRKNNRSGFIPPHVSIKEERDFIH